MRHFVWFVACSCIACGSGAPEATEPAEPVEPEAAEPEPAEPPEPEAAEPEPAEQPAEQPKFEIPPAPTTTFELTTLGDQPDNALGALTSDGASGGSLPAPPATEKPAASTVKCGPKTEVVLRKPELEGPLTAQQFGKVAIPRRAEIMDCYNRYLPSRPGLGGELTLRLVIQGNGLPTVVNPSDSTVDHQGLENCVANRMRRWTFPATDETKVTSGRVTWVLTPKCQK